MVGSLFPGSFISQPVIFLRDLLLNNIVDPGSPRPIDSKFVMTSYPQANVKYPLITVVSDGTNMVKRLGMQSEQSWMNIPIQITVWGKNTIQRDALSQQVFTFLEGNQFGAGSETVNFGMHDFKLNSSYFQSIEEGKDQIIQKNIMKFSWKAIV